MPKRQLITLKNEGRFVTDKTGTRYRHFSSNDYLGLAQHPIIRQRFEKKLQCYDGPLGAASSPLLTGFSPLHQQVIDEFCEFFGFEAGLIFHSGYTANLAWWSHLTGAHVFCDRAIHASTIDGLQQGPCRMERFRHNHIDDLKKRLAAQTNPSWIATEGIFSMHGDLAPLKDLYPLGNIALDDAHAVGIIGKAGRGSWSHAQLPIPDLLILPLGKAFGCQGGVLLSSKNNIDPLIESSRPFIYSTSIAPLHLLWISSALSMLKEADAQREHLQHLIDYWKQHIPHSNPSPIQFLTIGNTELAHECTQQLREKGFWVHAICPPTVPQHQTGIRFSLTAHLQIDDLSLLFETLSHMEHVHET